MHNWSAEPFIESAYLADTASTSISRNLAHSLDSKVFFAGDAYTAEDDWGGVHNALSSARRVVNELLQHLRASL